MPMLTVTPIYAALIAILMAVLSTRVGFMRGSHEVALGDGGKPSLALAIRQFGNLSEYAAVVLLLMLLMELQGVSADRLHLFGAVFVALRLIHPVILFDTMEAPMWKKAGRFVSAGGTAALMMIGAVTLLFG